MFALFSSKRFVLRIFIKDTFRLLHFCPVSLVGGFVGPPPASLTEPWIDATIETDGQGLRGLLNDSPMLVDYALPGWGSAVKRGLSPMASRFDNSIWRVANAVAGVLVLVTGFCSYETYVLVQKSGRVTSLNAMVPHSMFWSIGLATLLALYVYRHTNATTGEPVWAGYRALTIWLVAAIAFLPLPLALAFRWHVAAARPLYVGYILKGVCFLYLYWLFFRYHVLDDHNAFAEGWTLFCRRRAAGGVGPEPDTATSDGASGDSEQEPQTAATEDIAPAEPAPSEP